jgi:hypothetical protein
MNKILLTLLIASLLSVGACSRPKEEATQRAQSTPDPNLPKRMEQQQSAINRAAEQMKKEEQQKAASPPSPTPTVSPP